MTTTPTALQCTIYQGATFRLPLVRRSVPYPICADGRGGFKAIDGGNSVPAEDFADESYQGCQARMQVRAGVESEHVLLELTTENGGLLLVGNTLTIEISAQQTAGLDFSGSAIGHVEVLRPSGDVERQYEITFCLSPEITR